uniref:DUF19 domain-containing protein n=1 Tax=Panagrolaimus sp. PS1159 TaxID=55785 RepID=A0AC35FFT5_9BILA
MNCFLFFKILFLFVQIKAEYVDVLKQLYLTKLTSFFDAFTMRQCTYNEATTCFLNAYENGSCLVNVKNEFNETQWNPVTELEYTKPFMKYFNQCLFEKVKEFRHSDDYEPVALSVRKNLNADEPRRIEFDYFFKTKHRKCLKQNVKSCLRNYNCLLKLEFDAIDETLIECRAESFKKLRISLDSDDVV